MMKRSTDSCAGSVISWIVTPCQRSRSTAAVTRAVAGISQPFGIATERVAANTP